jgi:hypothetical protein
MPLSSLMLVLEARGEEGGLFQELGSRAVYHLRRRHLVTVAISPGLGDWEFEEL